MRPSCPEVASAQLCDTHRPPARPGAWVRTAGEADSPGARRSQLPSREADVSRLAFLPGSRRGWGWRCRWDWNPGPGDRPGHRKGLELSLI